MKALLLLLAVWAGVWLWRRRQCQQTPAPPAAPQVMVRCAVCGIHVPATLAWTDASQRHYCSAQHQQQAQGGA